VAVMSSGKTPDSLRPTSSGTAVAIHPQLLQRMGPGEGEQGPPSAVIPGETGATPSGGLDGRAGPAGPWPATGWRSSLAGGSGPCSRAAQRLGRIFRFDDVRQSGRAQTPAVSGKGSRA